MVTPLQMFITNEHLKNKWHSSPLACYRGYIFKQYCNSCENLVECFKALVKSYSEFNHTKKFDMCGQRTMTT